MQWKTTNSKDRLEDIEGDMAMASFILRLESGPAKKGLVPAFYCLWNSHDCLHINSSMNSKQPSVNAQKRSTLESDTQGDEVTKAPNVSARASLPDSVAMGNQRQESGRRAAPPALEHQFPGPRQTRKPVIIAA